jgi:hypothetical protein
MNGGADRRVCRTTTENGAPCRMRPLRGSDYCFNHSPEHSAERDRARQRGGAATRTPLASAPVWLRTVEAIQELLEEVVADTRMQGNTPDRSRTILAALRIALDAVEKGELEARLTELEERFGKGNPLAARRQLRN